MYFKLNQSVILIVTTTKFYAICNLSIPMSKQLQVSIFKTDFTITKVIVSISTPGFACLSICWLQLNSLISLCDLPLCGVFGDMLFVTSLFIVILITATVACS